jgi:hypothetical protein
MYNLQHIVIKRFIICLQVGSVPVHIAIVNGKVEGQLIGLQDMRTAVVKIL